jgi:hypothetical protein
VNISIRRTGACGFDILIQTLGNKDLQYTSMGELDEIVAAAKDIRVFPWSTDTILGISYRFLSGNVKDTQSLLNGWLKMCKQKYGKKLSIDKAWL